MIMNYLKEQRNIEEIFKDHKIFIEKTDNLMYINFCKVDENNVPSYEKSIKYTISDNMLLVSGDWHESLFKFDFKITPGNIHKKLKDVNLYYFMLAYCYSSCKQYQLDIKNGIKSLKRYYNNQHSLLSLNAKEYLDDLLNEIKTKVHTVKELHELVYKHTDLIMKIFCDYSEVDFIKDQLTTLNYYLFLHFVVFKMILKKINYD